MAEQDDPYEILRAANPVHTDELGDPAMSPAARAALERILSQPHEGWLGRLVRRRKSALIVGTVVLCGFMVAAAWALISGGQQRSSVGCYQSVSLHARIFVVARKGTPEATCAKAWKHGELSGRQPIRLEACVLPSGAIGVFPDDQSDACKTLGLAVYSRELSSMSDAEEASKLREDLANALIRRGCLNARQARSWIRTELARHGLSSWRIVTNGAFTAQRRCASAAVEQNSQSVAIIPVPRP